MAEAGLDGRDLTFERECWDDGVSVQVVTGEDVPLRHVSVRHADGLVQGYRLVVATAAGVGRTRRFGPDAVGTRGGVSTDGVAVDAFGDYENIDSK